MYIDLQRKIIEQCAIDQLIDHKLVSKDWFIIIDDEMNKRDSTQDNWFGFHLALRQKYPVLDQQRIKGLLETWYIVLQFGCIFQLRQYRSSDHYRIDVIVSDCFTMNHYFLLTHLESKTRIVFQPDVAKSFTYYPFLKKLLIHHHQWRDFQLVFDFATFEPILTERQSFDDVDNDRWLKNPFAPLLSIPKLNHNNSFPLSIEKRFKNFCVKLMHFGYPRFDQYVDYVCTITIHIDPIKRFKVHHFPELPAVWMIVIPYKKKFHHILIDLNSSSIQLIFKSDLELEPVVSSSKRLMELYKVSATFYPLRFSCELIHSFYIDGLLNP